MQQSNIGVSFNEQHAEFSINNSRAPVGPKNAFSVSFSSVTLRVAIVNMGTRCKLAIAEFAC